MIKKLQWKDFFIQMISSFLWENLFFMYVLFIHE